MELNSELIVLISNLTLFGGVCIVFPRFVGNMINWLIIHSAKFTGSKSSDKPQIKNSVVVVLGLINLLIGMLIFLSAK